jgi:capsular exopolysaccharide synthesis family protein
MGKVYEALKKAEVDGNLAAWTSVPADDPPKRRPSDRNRPHGLDFIDYSLNASDSVEIERRNRQEEADEAARKSMMQPAREMSIDITRIGTQLISFKNDNTEAAEEYNRLAVRLITTAGERTLKRVLLASAEHGDGRTSITLNLACALAKAQRRVLVVDTDLHRPSLLRLLGLTSDFGLTDAISRGLPAGSAMVRIQPFGFTLLPTREQAKNPSELLSSGNFTEMLNMLEADYDFLLFDSPPLLRGADSSFLIRHTHGTVLVIRAGKTKSKQLGRAIAALAPEKFLGVVLNRAA